MQFLHQIFPNLLILYRPQLQSHAAGKDGWKKSLRILRKQQNDSISGRLFYCLQKSILGLYCHLFRFIHNINLPGTAVGTYEDITAQLIPDIIHTDRAWLLMRYPDNVRLIPAFRLNTGAVSYTHLDVYKRQLPGGPSF